MADIVAFPGLLTEAITYNDPSSLLDIQYKGKEYRMMLDYRDQKAGNVETLAYVYKAVFDDGLSTEVQVNAEFTREVADFQAFFYAQEIGKMPHSCREGTDAIWIHDGDYRP